MRKLMTVLGAVFALIGCGERTEAQYVQGKHYEVLAQPVRTADPAKIEVVEVFSYGCGHCYAFEPLLQSWEKKKPSDVYLMQIHAMWNPQMEALVRGYYTSVMLGLKDRTHMAVFNAIHKEQRYFADADQWAEFFAGYGVDKAKALSAYNSFGVSSQIKQAELRAREYKITGTPEMVVNGKYRVSSTLTGGHQEMLKVVDFLVVQERSAKKK